VKDIQQIIRKAPASVSRLGAAVISRRTEPRHTNYARPDPHEDEVGIKWWKDAPQVPSSTIPAISMGTAAALESTVIMLPLCRSLEATQGYDYFRDLIEGSACST
jgi:hypothetical protein